MALNEGKEDCEERKHKAGLVQYYSFHFKAHRTIVVGGGGKTLPVECRSH